MSMDLVIHVETLTDVIWVPSQAVFEREGRWFVYRQDPDGFITHEVSLVRRTESQAVITGIEDGTVIALARPGQQTAPPVSPGAGAAPGGPMGAIPQ
jgi:hypothetical protein